MEGNSIAHGHPIGATCAIQTARVLHSMQRDGIRRGIVTMCIGGGQGTRTLFGSIHVMKSIEAHPQSAPCHDQSKTSLYC